MAFNSENLKEMRGEINAALKGVEEKYGVNFSLGSISFTANDFRVKLTCTENTESGESVTPEALAFQRSAKSFGITKQLGDAFVSRGETYTIVGLLPRSKKYPLLGKNANGVTYKFPALCAQ